MKLITITGPSGAGKDTVARMLSEITGIPVLVSYTTRKMREGEQNGREHWFVSPDMVPDKKDMLAYTQYGGYEYWTEIMQIGDAAIYVIDEEGLRDLHDRFPHIPIVAIGVFATRAIRRLHGVSEERMDRDRKRTAFPLEYFDYRIYNNRTIEHLREKVEFVAEEIKMMDSEPSPFIALVEDVKLEPIKLSKEAIKRIKKKYGICDE